MKRFGPVVLWLLAALASPVRAEGEGGSAGEPSWALSLAPYLWATTLEGTVDAEGVSSELDVPFSDIWDALDVGVLATAEARRGRLSLASNLIYLKLSNDAEKPVSPLLPVAPSSAFEVRAATQTGILELRPGWEVLSLPLFGDADARHAALDLGPGARVVWLDEHLRVKLRPGVPVGPFSRRFDGSDDWVDFVAFARVRAQLTQRVGLVVSGDYGGFDVGSSSHRTWSLAGFLSYRLAEHWELAGGWRTLEIERGPVDLEMAGPLVAAVCRFETR
jgi:hypothetical protein